MNPEPVGGEDCLQLLKVRCPLLRLDYSRAVKLIVLYGPPGTGKLTVARVLAGLTGFRLFHTHLTVDLAASLFAHGSPAYMDYVQHLRCEAFERAAAAAVDLVFTFWYSGVSRPSVERYRAIVEAHGGEVLFVRLWCRPEVLEAYPDSFSTISGIRLETDISDLAPEEVARQIAGYFGL